MVDDSNKPLRRYVWRCGTPSPMNAASRIRVYVYSVIAIALAGLLLLGDRGLLVSSVRKFPLFRAPERPVFQNEAGANPSGPAATNEPTEGEQKEDDFDAALRGLSSEDSLSGGATVQREQVAAPTPTRAVDDDLVDGEPKALREESDDSRQIFAGIGAEGPDWVDGSGVLGGVVSRSGGIGGGSLLNTPAVTPTNLRPWADGQARGYTMLYAMQPEARAVVETNVTALLASRVREPYIGVLIDGTFGRDFSYLKQVIARLSADERALTLVLYLSNGPHMRKGRDFSSDALFARLDPLEFRARIRREALLQSQFEAVAVQARDIFAYSAALNPANSNVAVVMLEDNLEVASYRAMRDLAAKHLSGLVTFVRNPCVGCYEGNDDALLGSAREEHQLSRFQLLREGDGFSLDGVGFRYPNTGGGSGISSEQLGSLMSSAVNRGLRYVGLWRHAWQGVDEAAAGFSQTTTRNYVPSTNDQVEYEIEALRMGLVEESVGEQ